jgi:radical SAM protein with 4Fe4S-binding SPASM domain
MFHASIEPSYEDRPGMVVWETTRACGIACKNCRSKPDPLRDCAELTTQQGKAVLDELAEASTPLVILTGGDPARRPDLVELVVHGRRRGLNVVVAPSATALATSRFIRRLADARVGRLAVRLDGPDAATHDALRGIAGSFQRSLDMLREARARGVKIEIDTFIHAGSIESIDAIADVVRRLGAALWRVVYPVPAAGVPHEPLPSADAVERSLVRLCDVAAGERFEIDTVAAPQYRRVRLQRARRLGKKPPELGALPLEDGRGALFVTHRGDICPSRRLPIACGNVKATSVVDVYQNSPIFRTLRDTDALAGRCGSCEYKRTCGGSRARAHAVTKSLLASDPLCAYVPPAFARAQQNAHSMS